jgi:hypothetical protein
MKQFCLTTHSESGDHYLYFIEHPTEPTHKELETFLKIHGSDIDPDDGECYEYVQECEEIKDFKKIPDESKPKKRKVRK